jgi:hypothetical protein
MFISTRFCAAGFSAAAIWLVCAQPATAQKYSFGNPPYDRDPSICRTPAEMDFIRERIKKWEAREQADNDKLARLKRVRETDNSNYQALLQGFGSNGSRVEKAKIEAASKIVKEEDLDIEEIETGDIPRDARELRSLRALKPCPPPAPQAASEPAKLYNVGTLRKPPTEPVPPTVFPFGPNGPFETAAVELSGFGGAVAASSFGSDFNPDIWGGRGAARLGVGQLRLQADIEGERTSDYSSIVGSRSYIAGGAHVDWKWSPNTEIGAFGGLQEAKPTFFGPTSTNYFVGLEGRQFFGPAMLGAQFGRFDVSSGPGTITSAWFVEGRSKFSLGDASGVQSLKYTIIGGNLGYGSGTAAATSMAARTTYWGLGLTQGIANTSFSLTLTYDHFENRVGGLGLVWNENKFMGGAKWLFPSTDEVRGWKEPTVPLPAILRTVMTF